eukprot:scaffold147791_cov24-Attheya_sp.AAC.1
MFGFNKNLGGFGLGLDIEANTIEFIYEERLEVVSVCRFNLEICGDSLDIDGHGFEIVFEGRWKAIEKKI